MRGKVSGQKKVSARDGCATVELKMNWKKGEFEHSEWL